MKTCTKCRKKLPESAFGAKRGGLDSQCRSCRAQYNAGWYAKNRKKRIKRVAAAVTIWRNKKREMLNQRKNVPCADCKKTFHPCAMDFDHVRGTKSFTIGSVNSWNVSLKRLEEEIKKCEIVCSNCHRLRTFSRGCSSLGRAPAR